MNRHLFRAAGAAGLLALVWVAAGYVRGHPVALLMTLLMGSFYALGALELHRFAQATAELKKALVDLVTPPTDVTELAQWLARLPKPLHTTVSLRVQGERAALPGPALAPYLAGLLVLLGMLGTFVGMVVTLKGTGLALEQATSVQGMRDALAAPVRGLGLAFGTSVAGVAASAMLGLMSALCRRDRQQAGLLLDSHTATTLQPFSRARLREQRRQTERALAQQQAAAQQQCLHEAAAQQRQALQEQVLQKQQHQHEQVLQQQHTFHLQSLQEQQRLQQLSSQSAQQLQAQQAEFLDRAEQSFRALATAVERSLQQHIDQALQQGRDALHAAVHAMLQGVAQEARDLQGQAARTVQQQVQAFTQQLQGHSQQWFETLGTQAQHQQQHLLQALAAAQAEHQDQQRAQDSQRLAAWAAALDALATQTEASASRAVAQAEASSCRAAAQAEEQARRTIAEVTHLVHSATEAPRAAAEGVAQMVAQLRQQISESLTRDTAQLEERSRIMATLNTVLAAAQHTATAQKAAIDQLVATTATWLQEAGARFTEQAQTSTERLEAVSAQLTSSAVDVASLGDAFAAAVDQFSQGSGQLLTHLQSLEAALARNTARSDEQLAYYVAQAREVIDLSLLSQKQIVDDLQRLGGQAWVSPTPSTAPPAQPAPAAAAGTGPAAARASKALA